MVGRSLESPSSSTVGIQMTLRYLSGTIETLNYTCSWRLILSRGVRTTLQTETPTAVSREMYCSPEQNLPFLIFPWNPVKIFKDYLLPEGSVLCVRIRTYISIPYLFPLQTLPYQVPRDQLSRHANYRSERR